MDYGFWGVDMMGLFYWGDAGVCGFFDCGWGNWFYCFDWLLGFVWGLYLVVLMVLGVFYWYVIGG